MPRLRVPTPRAHLLSERELIAYTLPHPSTKKLSESIKLPLE
jgi:hypothetical protein